ncbi:UDP-N-acetylmuramate--L-alanine ligase [Candidatus Gracilibacteria bacterium]|nr:UDP-N-acetylmuramate--L-alanine ligase [Candidatus Gracilibacteria bacterium]
MNIHFIGIGGIGNSALAQIYKSQGHTVSGSDSTTSDLTKHLEESGIKVSIGHNAENAKDAELIVYSPAIPQNNPELLPGVKTLSYPEALGELTKEYETIAVAGTHGKSTTTAMLASIMIDAGLDPTVVVGTKVRELDGENFRVGKGKYLLIEACEYKDSFLNFHTTHLIITNIEADHLDFYKTEEAYFKAFKELKSRATGEIITDSEELDLKPGVPGQFNVENARKAATLALKLGISLEQIQKSIANFKGTWRRYEIKENNLGLTMIDDYAHHPTEILATLSTIRGEYPDAKILCIFQPHQYSRTHLLLERFGTSFQDADTVIIPNIYEVRDTPEDIAKVNTDMLVAEIAKHNKNVKNGGGLEKTAVYLKAHATDYDVVVTMGAGDIDKIYSML